MATVTKNDLIDRIAKQTKRPRTEVRAIVQAFLENVVEEVGRNSRLEFRDFGVFEVKLREARMGQNPKTLEPVPIPKRRSVKFKPGRLMRLALESKNNELDSAGGPAVVVTPNSTPNVAVTSPIGSPNGRVPSTQA